MSVILAEKGPGLQIGRALPKLGYYKGVESCEVFFDGYETPADSVLGGEPGSGFAQDDAGTRGRADPGCGVRHGVA